MKKLLSILLYELVVFSILQSQVLRTDFLAGLNIGNVIEKGVYTSVVQDDTNPIKAGQWNLTGREDAHNFRSGSSPVVTNKLTYPGYIASGLPVNAIKLKKLSSGGRMSVYSMTSGSEYTLQPYYLAFMLKVENVTTLPDNNTSDFISFDGNYTGNHLRGRLILRKSTSAGKFVFALGGLEAGVEQTSAYTVGETLLIVLKYNFFSTDRSVSLYINPEITAGEPTVPDLKLAFPGTDMLAQIRGISIRQSSQYELTLGGFRFSDKWDDAVGYDSSNSQPGLTSLVSMDGLGNLTYYPDPDGFYLPDFSYAGYKNGEEAIPQIPVVKTISPIQGDNTAHIQTAIDEVGRRTPDANGFRGALLLQAGKYNVSGTLYVKYSGVVIRGVGNGSSTGNSTIIYATGNTPAQRNVMILGYPSQNTWNEIIQGSQKNIMDDIVPVGAYSFSVTDASPYKVGDQIIIYHPCTAQWLQAIDYGGVPAPQTGEADERWKEGELPIVFNRFITKIEGNKISVDAPVYYTLNKSLSQSYIYKYNQNTILKEIGIENLRIDIESSGGESENHAWTAIRFKSADYCWARDVVTKGFGFSGITTECTTRSTIENCSAIDPVSVITGERRYNFNAGNHSQLILFKNCYADKGRHSYVSNGTSSVSGIVFLNCVSDSAYDVSESHRKWSQGILYDNHKEINLQRNFVLGLYNRVDMGTGHGWSAVQSVLWNCDVTARGVIGLQKPPTSQNYAIGCTAGDITGKPVDNAGYVSDFPVGFVESTNKPVEAIPSLYLAQLNDRLNPVSEIPPVSINAKNYVLWQDASGVNIRFSGSQNQPKQLSVYGLDGKKIISISTLENDIRFQLPEKGVFLIQIVKNRNTFVEKVILN